MKPFVTFSRRFIIGLFAFLMLAFLVTSFLSTARISQRETMDYGWDAWWLHMLVLAAAGGLLWLLAPRLEAMSRRAEMLLVVLCALAMLALNAGIVLLSKSLPIFDQWHCWEMARQMAANYDPVWTYYYTNYFPHQMPYVLLLSLPMRLNPSPMWIQLLQAAGNVVGTWALAECAALLSDRRSTRLLTWLAALSFLPFAFYTPFVYGNLPGLHAMLLAALGLMRYLTSGKKRHLLWMTLFMLLSCLLKQNMLIAAIAAAIVLCLWAMQQKRWLPVLTATVMIVLCATTGNVINHVVESRTDANLSEGFPTSSWIMMGLSESEKEPGWYNENSYTYYTGYGYSKATHDELSKADIRQRLSDFAADPVYTLRFFGRKTLSQWNDPTFQSLWVNEMSRNPERSPLALSLYERGKVYRLVSWVMDELHLLALAGIVLWLWLCRRERGLAHLFFPLLLIGGFLFHLVWEAKGQYTFLYFFPLIAFGALGWLEAALQLGRREKPSAGDAAREQPEDADSINTNAE